MAMIDSRVLVRAVQTANELNGAMRDTLFVLELSVDGLVVTGTKYLTRDRHVRRMIAYDELALAKHDVVRDCLNAMTAELDYTLGVRRRSDEHGPDVP